MVVVGELKAHLRDHAQQAKNELIGKIKSLGTHWHRVVDTSAVEVAGGVDQSSEDFAESFFSEFALAVDPILVGVQDVDNSEILRRYFAGEPPFENKDAKKHEFPDAMALVSLESWTRNARTFMLVVSGDRGWKDFCVASDHLYCMDELPPALNLFNEDSSHVVGRALAKLRAGEAESLHNAISSSIESYLGNAELDADVDSWAEAEVDYVETNTIDWSLGDPGDADVISSDDEQIIFSVPAYANVEFILHILFRRWDREDREYMRLGSRTVPFTQDREIVLTITINRDIEPEPDVIDISTTPEHIYLDVGEVDPFDC
jgi:PIN domain